MRFDEEENIQKEDVMLQGKEGKGTGIGGIGHTAQMKMRTVS